MWSVWYYTADRVAAQVTLSSKATADLFARYVARKSIRWSIAPGPCYGGRFPHATAETHLGGQYYKILENVLQSHHV